jgi:hypothetical protein
MTTGWMRVTHMEMLEFNDECIEAGQLPPNEDLELADDAEEM